MNTESLVLRVSEALRELGTEPQLSTTDLIACVKIEADIRNFVQAFYPGVAASARAAITNRLTQLYALVRLQRALSNSPRWRKSNAETPQLT